LLTDLISYWKMDDASGNALDAHGTNDLTENGTIGTAAGIIDNARVIDADNEYFSHASNADLQTGDVDFTAQAWVKFTNLVTYRPIVCKDAGGSNREWNLLFDPDQTPDAIAFSVWNGSSNVGSVASSESISSDIWYHIVVRFTASSNELAIFVDNTKDTATGGSNPATSTADFEIGRLVSALGTRATIDEVGFWKRALTDDEVSQLYNGGAGLSYDDFGGGGVTAVFNAAWAGANRYLSRGVI
jgi:hypothetical protein